MSRMATLGPPVIQRSTEEDSKRRYLHKWVLYLSAPQVLLGAVCVIFQSILIHNKTEFSLIGQGFWAGIVFIIAGVLGIVSSQRKTAGPIVAFLVLSVIAAAGSLALLVPSAMEWRFYNDMRRYLHYCNRHALPRLSTPKPTDPGEIAIPLDAAMVCIALIQAVLAILCSAFACHGLCCGEKKQNSHQRVIGQVQYLTAANGQPQMVVIPMGQQGAALQPTGAMAGATTMSTAGFNIQPTQTPFYQSPTAAPPQYKMQETVSPQHGLSQAMPQNYIAPVLTLAVPAGQPSDA